jgi:hypothetical protein
MRRKKKGRSSEVIGGNVKDGKVLGGEVTRREIRTLWCWYGTAAYAVGRVRSAACVRRSEAYGPIG